jgi:transcriptional regulator NrdR family protein
MATPKATPGVSPSSPLDKIAYVRFASVYRDFQDVEAFLNELQDLLQKRGFY